MRFNILSAERSCSFLLFIIVVWYLQLLVNIGIIGQAIILFIMIFSAFCVVRLLASKQLDLLGFTILLFLFLNSVYFIVADDWSQYGKLRSVFLNLLVFFPFYMFAKQGVLTREKILLFVSSIAVICVLTIYTNDYSESSIGDFVNNYAYMLLGIIPFTFLFKRKEFSLLFLMLLFIPIVQSNKRAVIIMWLIAFLLTLIAITLKGKLNFRKIITLCLGVPGILYFLYEMSLALVTQSDVLKRRFVETIDGNSTGRFELYEETLNAWLSSNDIFYYLFGFGYNASYRLFGITSHNDYFGVIISFGLFGFFVFVLMVCLIYSYFFRKNWDYTGKYAFLLFLAALTIATLTSRWYEGDFAYMTFLLLPYLLVNNDSGNCK